MIAGILEIQLLANMARLSDDMRRAERVVGDSMGKVERSVASAKRALSSLGMGVSIGLLADQMRRTADTFVKLDAQIRNSTKSQQQYNQALADIRRISTIAQADISATTMLYTRLLNTTDGMGISQGKLATVTETVVFGLKAYGATSAEAASAALQLSQAMGANRLGGEEFRAAMEAMPNVMKVLAKSMGVPLGELRALSIAGKITTAEMVKAFGDPAVAVEFKRMAEGAQTITGAWTVARNELTLMFGEFAKSSGLTQGMIAAFNGLAGALRTMGQYLNDVLMLLGAWAVVVAGRYLSGMVAAHMAQRAMNAAHAEALVMNAARERATLAEITSRYSNIAAIRTQTLAELQARQAKTALAIAEAESTIAQLNHARAAGMLSGHLYIVRQVEMELVVATNALTAANQARAATMAEMVALGKLQTTANAEITASTAAVARAESLRVAGATTALGRMSGAVAAFAKSNAAILVLGSLGVAALALKRDFDAAIDSVGKFQEKIRGMEVDALRAARQLEVANVASMKSSIFSGFNERDILFAERRIRMMDAQIVAAEKLAKGRGSAGDGNTHQSRMLQIAQELEAQTAADAKKLTHSERVSLAWAQLKRKDQTAQEGLNYAIAQQAALELDALEVAKKAAAEREAIAGSVAQSIIKASKSGNVGQSILNDIQDAFEKNILEPQIKAVVLEAMPLFEFKDTALVSNTAALQANTAALSGQSASGTASSAGSGGTWGIVIAAVLMLLKFMIDKSATYADRRWTELKASSAMGVTGRRAVHYTKEMTTIGEALRDMTRYGTLGTVATNTLNAALKETVATFAAAGDMIGATDVRTKDFSVSIKAEGDAVAALTNGIGTALIPALRTMQREGETLADTAKRITETFKATNDFIVSLGVSQGAAFGGFGLGGAAGREALIAASGGLQAFTQNAQGFVKNFLTPAQQVAPALDDVGRTFSRLGIQGIAANEQFAALVKQQMELGNTDVVAQLLSVADSFNAVTTAAADTNKQLTALLRKDLFSTLVDYIRATTGVGAAGMIAGAVATAGGVMAQEAAGTAAMAGTFTEPSAIEDLSQSGWMGFTGLIKKFLSDLWQGFKDLLGKIWEGFKELPGKILDLFKKGWEQLPNPGDLFGGLPGLGGGGLPMPPSFGLWANGGAFGMGGVHAFANGGAFTNGVFNTPTPFMFADGAGFSPGVMGEAGDEAVMPLRRGADGRLGVSMHGGPSVAEEVRLLRAEVSTLRRDNQAGQVAIATATQRTYKTLDRWNGEGIPPERIAG